MNINPAIFKAYDIRGIYPTDLDEEWAYRIGRAFVVWLKKSLGKLPNEIVVGRDGRISGPKLVAALKKGIIEQGVNIIDIGIVASEQFYFACGYFKLPGVTVTASHNPKEYNGMKFVKQLPYFLSGQEGINDIRDLVIANKFPVTKTTGTIQKKDIRKLYAEKLLSVIKPSEIGQLKVVVDTANGVGGPAVADVAKKLPIKLTHIYSEVDGNFPNHPADPLRPENRRDIELLVKKNKADVGFAFDGDGDRCFVIDELGQVVPNDFLGALLAQEMLKEKSGSAIIYDVRSSWAFPQLIGKASGRAVMEKVGHSFIKPRMLKEEALYGAEVSGHHYFKDFFYCDSGVLVMLTTLKLLSETDQPLSVLVKSLRQKYFISGEINFKVTDTKAAILKLKNKFKLAPKVYELDGISVEYPDWHFNVRASNTEPLLRLNLESIVSKKHLLEKLKELKSVIEENKG